MRRLIWIAIALGVLLAFYAIWPVVGFYRIASAVEARDSAGLARLVDFPLLRKSLAKQVALTYLEIAGEKKKKKLGPIEQSIALGVGTSIANSVLADLVNEDTLIDLLTKGETKRGLKIPAELSPFTKASLRSGWQTWWNFQYRGGAFYSFLPPDAPPDKQFRVKLILSDWQWKLAGLELPAPLRLQLARKVIEKQKAGEGGEQPETEK